MTTHQSEDSAAMDNGLCSCGHDVLDHGFIEDGNGWEASPCRLCNCLDSDWGKPSLHFLARPVEGTR